MDYVSSGVHHGRGGDMDYVSSGVHHGRGGDMDFIRCTSWQGR